ncbi:Plant peroxidase [Macleaya cordata]|uniref:Peroxidase n=1 Tax=Macleaya cordata TaxID=56857 RepID=A0A200Q3Q1_MACCD|nr:Plant peroxidase [Macleaya cordata]
MASFKNLLLVAFALFLLITPLSHAQLSLSFYDKTCSSVLDIVKSTVRSAINRDKRMGAKLIRMFFHDCFVVGCDAGVLLDDNLPSIDSEKNSISNKNSLGGFELIDKIKDAVDQACPGPVVSCSDIISIATRDSVVELGGPSWSVLLGRRDARTANRNEADNLPSPFADLQVLIKNFSDKGFTAKEMVALSGAHSVGVARCSLFRTHLYNGSNVEVLVANERKSKCPSNGGDDNLASIDHQTPNRFGNNYFQALVTRRGLLHSDQELFNGGSTDDIVKTYSQDSGTFYTDFANAMIKLGNLNTLTGNNGEIRKNCRKIN